MSPVLVYAVVRSEDVAEARAACDGLVDALADGPVAALFEERDRPPGSAREEMLDFASVVSLVSKAVPTLPVRYGTLLDGRADLATLVVQSRQAWRQRLDVVAGHVELVLQVRDAAAPALVGASPGAGREYLMSRVASHRHEGALWRDLTATVAGLCREHRRLSAPAGAVRVACLVPEGAQDALQEELEEWAGAAPDRHVTLSGPWPAFSFAEEDPDGA